MIKILQKDEKEVEESLFDTSPEVAKKLSYQGEWPHEGGSWGTLLGNSYTRAERSNTLQGQVSMQEETIGHLAA